MYYVYMMANWNNYVLYTGMTNDLERRIFEHKNKFTDSFTKRYKVNKLVYFEYTENVDSAIAREKQIKGWVRKKKNELINSVNPEWRDLANDWKDPLHCSG